MGAVGWLIGAHVQSPADAAASHRAPAASLITVPVEQRILTAKVIAQGTVSYGPPRSLSLSGVVAVGDAGGESGQLITKAPTTGSTLHEGDVLLEVSGRPVFVFTGPVPMYRTLVKGNTGDDVRQLRTALRKLMPDRNLASTGPFNDAVIAAVKGWYEEKGYTATGPTTEAKTRLRELEQAATGEGQARADAEADLKEFKKSYGVSIASGEVLFLPKLPTRLDTVSAKAGGSASGEIGTVADPVLVVNGNVGSDDAELLKKGLSATLESTGGASFKATLGGIGASVAPVTNQTTQMDDGSGDDGGDSAAESAAGVPIRLKPRNPKKLAQFAGQSVKITIKVGGTGKAVLTVPVAAVFTSTDTHARVNVEIGPGQAKDVPVTTGLTTNGFVQVTPIDGAQLHTGDRVVVGKR